MATPIFRALRELKKLGQPTPAEISCIAYTHKVTRTELLEGVDLLAARELEHTPPPSLPLRALTYSFTPKYRDYQDTSWGPLRASIYASFSI